MGTRNIEQALKGHLEKDCIMVIDSRLPYVINPFQGLKPGGAVILNSRLASEEACARLGLKNIGGMAVLKATDIANDVLGTPITNIVMLGAFSKMHESISLEAMKQGIRTGFDPGQIGSCRTCRKSLKASP